ncbi:MAG: hypothetical protein ABJL55_16230 [Roseibium sp.]
MEKTYKRETAWAMLGVLAVLCVYDLTNGGDTAAWRWAEMLSLPIFGFAVAAFGLDAAAKQWRPQRRSEQSLPPEGFD